VSWRRLKHLASIAVSNVDKKTVSDERSVRLCNYTDVYYNERITAELPFMEATASADQIASFGLRADDVLLTKDSETPDDIAVPAYVVADLPDVVCGYHLALLRPSQEVDGRYLFWALGSRSSREQFSASANGITRFGLRYDSFGEVLVPLPPIATQRAIADYLDRETARIDALIEKKQRMKELLQERRQTLITEAISRSHDPGTAARSDRLRTVPLKRIVGINLHTLPETTEPGFEFRYVDIGAVGRGQLLSEPEATVFAAAPSRARRLVRQGDTIISTVRTYLRAVWPVRDSATDLVVSTGFAVLTPTRSIDSRYLGWLVQSDVVVEEVVARSVGVSYPAINPSDIGTVRVPLPPLARQRAIADYLDQETARIDALVERIDRQVALLQEHRQALITAAVTGELEIPGVAA
jgi:type I restriction enzyme S subunit